jgi:hypothetical protein
MKKFVFALLLLASCAKEDSVGPASAKTFIRYFNGGNSDEAKAILETSDKGLLILATTQVAIEGSDPIFKIKLIKTDAFGNLVWQKLYPEINNTTDSYKGNGFTIDPAGGYVIVGEDIKSQKSNLLILSVAEDGSLKNLPKTMTSTYEAKGMGVAVITSPTNSAAGNVRILSAVTDPAKDNMLLAEFTGAVVNGTAPVILPIWTRLYGAGESVNLSNKLFQDADNNSYWSGTVIKTGNPANIRLVKTPTNSLTTFYDFTPSSTFTETTNDVINPLGGDTFFLVGKSNATTPSSTGIFNISFKRYFATNEFFAFTYPFPEQDGDADGNSVAAAQDGGYILLGTAKLSGTAGRGETDYCMIKVDSDGKQIWTKSYGSKYEDVGVGIITTSDGGHVILGTTNLANTKSILVMKTDSNGNIE